MKKINFYSCSLLASGHRIINILYVCFFCVKSIKNACDVRLCEIKNACDVRLCEAWFVLNVKAKCACSIFMKNKSIVKRFNFKNIDFH